MNKHSSDRDSGLLFDQEYFLVDLTITHIRKQMQLSAQHHPRPVTSKLHARRPDRIQHVCRASGLCVQQQESAPSPVQRRTILSGTLPCLLALQGLRPPAADAIGCVCLFSRRVRKEKAIQVWRNILNSSAIQIQKGAQKAKDS